MCVLHYYVYAKERDSVLTRSRQYHFLNFCTWAVYVVFYTSYFLVQICTTLNLFTFELEEYVCKHERGQFANTNAVVRPNTHIDTANTIAVIANTNAVICPSLIYVT